MLVLITYDVNTEDTQGSKRLRKVAKICVNYGQRVQNSVFECILDTTQLSVVRHELLGIIDPKKDSLRIYNLGNKADRHIESYGREKDYSLRGDLIF